MSCGNARLSDREFSAIFADFCESDSFPFWDHVRNLGTDGAFLYFFTLGKPFPLLIRRKIVPVPHNDIDKVCIV